ncbi:MAG: LemA family protein [Micavibrio sp.]|nr:MAG: LemA family protein [Micavibrio sp.]
MEIFLVLLAVLAGGLIYIFNRLVKQRQRVNEGWSGIDVQLKRRADLIPSIVTTVKGYAAHESTVLERVTKLRTKCIADQNKNVVERNASEKGLAESVGQLMAVAENYPDLKADKNFRELQTTLVDVEDHLQMSRRYYNGTVRDMNILVESFPSNLVAKIFKFGSADFFEIDNPIEKYVPEVKFETQKQKQPEGGAA